MEFLNLRRIYQRNKWEMDKGIARVMEHGKFILGPEVEGLEAVLADMVGMRHCVTCASGTDALLMALLVSDKPTKKVGQSVFTFQAAWEMTELLGTEAVFTDVESMSNGLKTEAPQQDVDILIVTDLFGVQNHYGTYRKSLSDPMIVIVDAAQAFGAGKSYDGADIVATSFHPAKPLGCFGDGGACFTDDNDDAERLREIRNHGRDGQGEQQEAWGLNSRLDSIQAAILLARLPKFAEELSRREFIASIYGSQIPLKAQFHDEEDIWSYYSVVSPKRDEIVAALAKRGVPTRIHYSDPLQTGAYPVANELSRQIFQLPIDPYMTIDEIRFVVDTVNQTLEEV
jgi:UDP-2-acetamido-2-deoxy-ribo-hexuluronate aminotransferase